MDYLTWKDIKSGLFLTLTTEPAGEPVSGAGGGKGAPDPAAEIAALKAELAALKSPPKPDESDLSERARLQSEKDQKEKGRTKQLENALKFNISAPEFLKTNESLLPKEISDIFKQAEKENYSDAIEKDSAIKAGMIQAFFQVQTNMDLLTPGQKESLDGYLKLTKTGKQDNAQQVYSMIFEPAFETLKRVKRAEALSKGYGNGSDSETAYKTKMMALSKKHYGLGDK